ncbi:hypothetical protein [Bacillus cereus]|uniref:hypothetical protein n=1 Tax=Bacillus cereus TaxID=1396 RepID=UPI000BF74DF6|nr:hypothetical protein [Bacillus cereus]PFB24123.1 hypothetical protein CN388_25465 [Bacillus cereus]
MNLPAGTTVSNFEVHHFGHHNSKGHPHEQYVLLNPPGKTQGSGNSNDAWVKIFTIDLIISKNDRLFAKIEFVAGESFTETPLNGVLDLSYTITGVVSKRVAMTFINKNARPTNNIFRLYEETKDDVLTLTLYAKIDTVHEAYWYKPYYISGYQNGILDKPKDVITFYNFLKKNQLAGYVNTQSLPSTTYHSHKTIYIDKEMCILKRDSDVTLGSNSEVGFVFNLEEYDNNNIHDKNNYANVITPKQGGVYALRARIMYDTNPNGHRSLIIYKNDTKFIERNVVASQNDWTSVDINEHIYLISGDSLTMKVSQNSGTGIRIFAGHCLYSLVKID